MQLASHECDWLGYKDSNLNYLIQNQAYYRYTIPHYKCGADEEIRTLTRSPSLRPERSASASSATSARPPHHYYTRCAGHLSKRNNASRRDSMTVSARVWCAIPRCAGNPGWVRGWQTRHRVCTRCRCTFPIWGRSRRRRT